MKLKKMLSVVLTGTLLLSSMTGVYAASKNKEGVKWEQRRAYIESKMTELGSNGPEAVDSWLEENGIVKVDDIVALSTEEVEAMGIGDVTIQSAPGSVSLYSIQGYYDTQARMYLVKGWWKWNSMSLVDPQGGALDGVSLAMAKTTDWTPVTGYVLASNPAGIAVYDNNGTHYPYAGNSSKIDKSGILYTFQDVYNYALNTYVGFQGQVWFWMQTKPSQSPMYIKMDFYHTWTSANLSSYGFSWPVGSAPTLNMTWNSTPENFQIHNQYTLSSWPNF